MRREPPTLGVLLRFNELMYFIDLEKDHTCCCARLAIWRFVFSSRRCRSGAFAQADAPTEEASPEPTAKERPAATQAKLDARGKAVHDQLASVTEGAERYRLLNELADA
jgi:hypothetical protein